ncbi:MAG: hypothetical protein KDA31_13270 [Phycisphaerales bacterium]|nr:hypothetical protein [Phycisphaerales bacterium]MCB9835234.1 hypothetical protein [Phycisphaera sp.]
MSESETKVRVCQACGKDCSGQPRIKDKKGRYLHKACYEKALAKAKKRQPVEVMAPRKRPAAAAATAVPVPTRQAEPTDIYGLEDDALGLGGDDMFADMPAADPNAAACPECGSAIPGGSVLCTVCGHNFQTGKSAGRVRVSKETALGNATKATASNSAAWLLALIGSSIGGAIGAFAWAMVALLLNLEHGYIAVGVGFLCGLGAAVGAQSRAGIVTGLVASGVAILAIAVGKFAVVQIAVDSIAEGARESMQSLKVDANSPWFTDQDALLEMVFDEVTRRERRGETLVWPMGMSWDEAYELDDYPLDITTKVKSDWQKLTDEERSARKDALMRENQVASIANQIASDRIEAGQSLAWPAGMTYEEAYLIEDYPKDIVEDAGARWDGMTRAEQASYVNEKVEHFATLLESGEFTAGMMAASYSMKDLFFDAIWIILAVGTAFGVGANSNLGESGA